MQFQVPQFIEVEDKIFGPLTFKQFVYVIGGVGAAYLLWRALPLVLAGPLIAGVGGLAAALAFMQWNGRPFIVALENAFFYMLRSKLYLWNNAQKGSVKKAVAAHAEPGSDASVYVPKLSDSKLHELAWSLDIKERIAAGVASENERRAEAGVIMPIRTAQEALVHRSLQQQRFS
ncbi:MAG: PrgI family protein [Candidatus Kaiserbacteria bacterium]|nr:MAG: PrgI family protein [Candidatus Kaiserbacteria bacterium]